MALSEEQIQQIATKTADAVMERVKEREHDSLMLHSIPYLHGSPGIVLDEAKAKATPCKCVEYGAGKKLCWSAGVIGALDDMQEKLYCPSITRMESPGTVKRMRSWQEAVDACKAEIADIPKEEGERRMTTWMRCMSRELEARGVTESSSEHHSSSWGKPFYYRGLQFREHSGGIGIQVYDPTDKKWYNTAFLNRRTLEQYKEVPDVAKWGEKREHLGTVRFPISNPGKPPEGWQSIYSGTKEGVEEEAERMWNVYGARVQVVEPPSGSQLWRLFIDPATRPKRSKEGEPFRGPLTEWFRTPGGPST